MNSEISFQKRSCWLGTRMPWSGWFSLMGKAELRARRREKLSRLAAMMGRTNDQGDAELMKATLVVWKECRLIV